MTTERRKAPRRKITEIEKTGRWGNVSYLHHLSCGHIESRKRASATSEIACAWCLRAEQKNEEMKALVRVAPLPQIEPSLADEEVKIEKTRASLAIRFGVPQDAVDISVEDVAGILQIRSATIYLSASDVARATDGR